MTYSNHYEAVTHQRVADDERERASGPRATVESAEGFFPLPLLSVPYLNATG